MKKIICILMFALLISLVSCSADQSDKRIEGIISEGQESIVQAIAYQCFMSSALKSTPDKPIKELSMPITEQGIALGKAKADNKALVDALDQGKKNLEKLEGSWGVRLQRLVTAFVWWLIGATVVGVLGYIFRNRLLVWGKWLLSKIL